LSKESSPEPIDDLDHAAGIDDHHAVRC
jgi:hypothetical protein